MKVPIKSDSEVDIMRRGGKITSAALHAVKAATKAGISPLELDRVAEKVIREMGAESSFKRVPGYKYTLCACVNDTVVHGIPTETPLKAGDIFGIDVGSYLDGFHTDLSYSVIVMENGYWEPELEDMEKVRKGEWKVDFPTDPAALRDAKTVSLNEKKRFLSVGKLALIESIEQAKAGNHIGDISHILQTYLEGAGYGVVRELIGHGVGKDLHEPPQVPGRGKPGEGMVLKKGMVLAIEAIYSLGGPKVAFKNNDGWTIVTEDYSLAGLYEQSVAITDSEPEVLTVW
jgi:methionyl aminopeptidase